MAGFNLPITIYTPAQLDQLARAAFKAPALMGMGGGGGGGGMGGGGGAAAPGFDAAAAGQTAVDIAKLGKDLFADKAGMPETAAVSSGDLAGTVSSINALQPSAGGTWAQPTMPTNIGYGGGAADGGPVVPGKYYTVGERGPETFVPSVPGYIVPNEERDFFGGRRQRR